MLNMVYDESRDRLVLVGVSRDRATMETWEWDGDKWLNIPVEGPLNRTSFAMAYYPDYKVTVLFGGWIDVDHSYRDTWHWNGDKWTQISKWGPEARDSTEMAYHPLFRTIILYGGIQVCETHTKYFRDTWEWDGNVWSKAPGGLEGRWGHTMAFDPISKKIVLFGGFGIDNNDTYGWDGEYWSVISTSGPEKRHGHGMAYDRARDKMVLYGGRDGERIFNDTWEYTPQSNDSTNAEHINTGVSRRLE